MAAFLNLFALPLAIVMDGGLLADSYGRHMRERCHTSLNLPLLPEGYCRDYVVRKFTENYPAAQLAVDRCVDDREGEELMWAAISDRGWSDKYLERLAAMCGTAKEK